jgi:hypothetical protein
VRRCAHGWAQYRPGVLPLVVTSHRPARSGRLAHFEVMGKGLEEHTLRRPARTEWKPNGNGVDSYDLVFKISC